MIGAGNALIATWLVISLLILYKVLQTRFEKLLFLGVNFVLALAAGVSVFQDLPAFSVFYLGMSLFYLLGLAFMTFEMFRGE